MDVPLIVSELMETVATSGTVVELEKTVTELAPDPVVTPLAPVTATTK
jgi:hypothetical protein